MAQIIRNLEKEFEQLQSIMTSSQFRESTATSGELPIYIYDYPAEKQVDVDQRIGLLIDKLEDSVPEPGEKPIRICHVNLYDLAMNIIEQRGLLDRVLDYEKTNHTVMSANSHEDKFLKMLDNFLGADGKILPEALQKEFDSQRESRDATMLFISGVGAVYPYIRVHTLLETMQGRFGDCPVVLFYPGTYTTSSTSGSTMRLYGLLAADNYYRAVNLRDMMKD